MSKKEKNSMFEYYNLRASSFDKVYLDGGPGAVSDSQAYPREVEILSKIINRVCSGNLIDVACGTAFWLPHYLENCNYITLLDQSEEMLREAHSRVDSFKVADKTKILTGDVLEYNFARPQFDTILVAFFISLFTAEEEANIFRKLKSALKPNGRILLLDSVWNDARAATRKKESTQKRSLANGRKYEVYKKYFNKVDVLSIASNHGLNITVEHFGEIYFAAVATNKAAKI